MSAWTAEMDARLARLWGDGLSTTKIGLAMKLSKNSIVGRAHRQLLPPRPSPIKFSDAPKERVPPVARAKKATLPALACAVDVKPVKKTAVVLVMRTQLCCWPIGTPGEPDFHFCDVRGVVAGKPYCAAHCAVAYTGKRQAGPVYIDRATRQFG
jgi:GcrA cell cycle regulator